MFFCRLSRASLGVACLKLIVMKLFNRNLLLLLSFGETPQAELIHRFSALADLICRFLFRRSLKIIVTQKIISRFNAYVKVFLNLTTVTSHHNIQMGWCKFWTFFLFSQTFGSKASKHYLELSPQQPILSLPLEKCLLRLIQLCSQTDHLFTVFFSSVNRSKNGNENNLMTTKCMIYGRGWSAQPH